MSQHISHTNYLYPPGHRPKLTKTSQLPEAVYLPYHRAPPSLSDNKQAFYNTSSNFINHSQSTRADVKYYTKAEDFYKSPSSVRLKEECFKAKEISVPREELTPYEDEIKKMVDKMLKINGYPKLELKKATEGRYTVSLEDLALVLATIISDVIRKNKEIKRLEEKVGSVARTGQNVKCSSEFKDLQMKYEEALKEIKKLEYSSVNTNMQSKEIMKDDCTIKSHSNALNILEDIQKFLKVKKIGQISQAIRRMNQLLNVIPQMESFIREVSSVVQQSSNSFRGLESVVPILKQWANERLNLKNRQAFKLGVCQILYGREADVTDQQIVLFILIIS